MTEVLSLALAVVDFSQIPAFLRVALRIFLAVAIGGLSFFVLGPMARLLFRLAFQRPMHPTLTGWVQLIGAVLVGVLVFLFMPLPGGLGGGMFGGGGNWFGGGEGGEGSGVGRKDGKGVEQETKPGEGKGKVDGEAKPKPPREGVLEIEMMANNLYEKGSGRYYLIRTPETPTKFATVADYQKQLKTREEVEAYLDQNARRFNTLEIQIFRNSPEPDHPFVQALIPLAARHKLEVARPKYFQDLEKTLEK